MYNQLIQSLEREVDDHRVGSRDWLQAKKLVGRAQTVTRFYKEFVASEDLQEILDIIIQSDDAMEIIGNEKVAEFITLNGGPLDGQTLKMVMTAWRTHQDPDNDLYCPLREQLDQVKMEQKEQLGCFENKQVKFVWAALYGQRELDQHGGNTEYMTFGQVARSIRNLTLGE